MEVARSTNSRRHLLGPDALARHPAAGGALAVALAAVTFAAMLYFRREWELASPPPGSLGRVVYDAYAFGRVFQSLALPTAAIGALLAARRLPLPAQTNDPGGTGIGSNRRRALAAGAVIAGIFAVTLAAGAAVQDEVGLYFFSPVVAGLLAGPLAGGLVGLVGYAFWIAVETSGLAGYTAPLADALIQPGGLPVVWTGLAAGLLRPLAGAARLAVPRTASVAALVAAVGTLLSAVIWEDPTFIVAEMLAPVTLLTGVAVGAVIATALGVRDADAVRRAEAAELARARAELRAMRAQINPHFLFNSLNTIRYFARTDPGRARQLLLDLSDVYQRAFRAGDTIPLRDELRHVEAYVALEQARLGDRLRVTWDRSAANGMSDQVPTLILQPIVENAVLHAAAAAHEGSSIHIRIQTNSDELRFEVEDDGPGIAPERLAALRSGLAISRPDGLAERDRGDDGTGAGQRRSIGLQNVDGRLRALYGPGHGLVIDSEPGRGTRVRFSVPRDGSRALERS